MALLARWDQELSTEATNEVVKGLAHVHLLRVTEAKLVAGEISRLIVAGDFLTLCRYELDYNTLVPHEARELRQALAFYSKRQDLELGVDRELAAWSKFVSAENACAETNDVFKQWSRGKFQFSHDVEAVLFSAQRKIARCLGDVPNLRDLKLKFGPGATTNRKRRDSNPRYKLGDAFACSEALVPRLHEVLDQFPQWSESMTVDGKLTVEIHPGRLSFVPKNALTDRGIVVEPMLNTMCQLGFGDFIARRLLSVDQDITDQSRNQRLAREGSLSGDLATLDLSSASDCIATELVAHLLPVDWMTELSFYRSPSVDYRGKRIQLQKFSSMGNGFTFPLETLIFWSLAVSCVHNGDEHRVSVYGDDIIVPTYAYALLSKVLTSCGFEVNHKKSFASGPFRESCGEDYLMGFNVRPIYIRDRLSGESLFLLHNKYVRDFEPELAARIRALLDSSLICYGPDGYGDGHLLGEWDAIPFRRDRGWSGYTFETFTFKNRRSFRPSPGDYVFPCYCIYSANPFTGVTVYDKDAVFDGTFLEPPEKPSWFSQRCLIGSIKNFVARISRSDGAIFGQYDKEGRLGVPLPGRKGYKRIKIYTLHR